jgi:ELWxxDGT repeat protein
MVLNINTAPATAANEIDASSYPQDLTVMGTDVYFAANDGIHGEQLWVSDGTSAGTHMVADINTGFLSGPLDLTVAGNQLFFSADDGVHGSELWVSDGTATGTHLVLNINTQPVSGESTDFGSFPFNLTAVGNKLFFTADDGIHGEELWVSDGTAAGTHLVEDLNATPVTPGPFNGNEITDGSNPTALTADSSWLYFQANDGIHGSQIWKTDGTAAHTVQVTNLDSNTVPVEIANVGSQIFFSTRHNADPTSSLYETDGTAAGTVKLADYSPTNNWSFQGIHNLASVDGRLYFDENNSLWTSDGTVAGTQAIRAFGKKVFAFGPSSEAEFQGHMFFEADDGVHGAELWQTDGSTAGTHMVKDINSVTLDSNPSNILTIGNVTYFSADDGNGTGLWKTDGTAVGTQLVKTIFNSPTFPFPIGIDAIPFFSSGSIGTFVNFQGKLYFTANDGVHGSQLWTSDGTGAGTVMVTDFNSGNGNGGAAGAMPIFWGWPTLGNLTVVGQHLYFTRNTGNGHTELWESDGSRAGAILVRNFQLSQSFPIPLAQTTGAQAALVPYFGPSAVSNLTDVNGVLFFVADDGTHGSELWTSDGTPAGTVLVKDINPSTTPPWNPGGQPIPNGSDPSNLTVLNGKLYFFADDGVHGRELWVSDGNTAGTNMVEDIDPGSAGAFGYNGGNGFTQPEMIASNGELFFNADDGVHGQQLWKSDGTAAGTHMVADITANAPGGGTPMGASIQGLTEFQGEVFFNANDGLNGSQLWKSDGAAAGTQLLTNINSPPVSGSNLPAGIDPQDLFVFNGKLYFTANDGLHGQQLWASDGAANGTGMVQDLNPNGSAFSPWPGSAGFTAGPNGLLLFTANDGRHGVELWKLDDTAVQISAGGTYEVIEGQNLALHATIQGASDPRQLHFAWDLDGDGVFDDARGANVVLTAGQMRNLRLHGGPELHTIAVQVTDAAGNVIGVARASLKIDDAPLVVTSAAFDVTEGKTFNRNVASFTDPGGAEDITQYQATINWGDGSTSKGTILLGGSHLRVSGQHAYAEQGAYTVSVSVTDGGGPASTAQTTVTVHDAPIHAQRVHIRTTVGQSFNGPVARFHDDNPLSKLGEFSAQINWGDGSTSAGTIQANGQGNYVVLGSHTFAHAHSYPVDVTILDDGQPLTMAHSTAQVDPLPLVARGLTGVAKANTDFTLALAAFHDSEGATASIDWADGTTSAGTIQTDGSGGLKVLGSHRFGRIGLHSVRISIQDSAGRSVTATGTVSIVA